MNANIKLKKTDLMQYGEKYEVCIELQNGYKSGQFGENEIYSNVVLSIKQFKVSYCYGGRYKGECKLERIIEAIDENEARDKFNATWHSEEIYSITPISTT